MNIVHSPDVCSGYVGADLVLFSPHDRRLHVLNSTAAHVWEHMTEPIERRVILRDLAGAFEVNEDEIRSDVFALIARFFDAGLCVDGTSHGALEPHIQETDGPAPAADLKKVGFTGTQVVGPIRALGIPIVVESIDELVRVELERILDPLRSGDVDFLDPTDTSRLQHIVVAVVENGWQVIRNGAPIATVGTRDRAIRMVLAECNAAPLPHIDDAVVLHAAGAEFAAGLVILPGLSNAGKSTLVTQLLERGCAYLTDEAVAVDLESLHARPFTKAICIEQGAQSVFSFLSPWQDKPRSSGDPGHSEKTGTWDIDPRGVGEGQLSRGGPVSAIVFPTYDPDGAPGLRPVESFDALKLLLANAFDFGRIGQPAFAALVRLANALPVYALSHPGGTAHLDQLETMFGARRVLSL
jgi:hypothetical protein